MAKKKYSVLVGFITGGIANRKHYLTGEIAILESNDGETKQLSDNGNIKLYEEIIEKEVIKQKKAMKKAEEKMKPKVEKKEDTPVLEGGK